MKFVLIYLCISKIILQANALGTPPRTGRPYTVSTSSKAAFERLRAQPANKNIVLDKRGFRKIGDKVLLRLANGRQLRLVSKPASKFEDDVAELMYLGKLPTLNKYVLLVLVWENSFTLLVDQTTGIVDTLRNDPIPSPGNKRLAALFQGYPVTDDNGIEIYTVQSGRVRQQFSIEQSKWIPHDLAWINDKSFIIKCLPFAEQSRLESMSVAERTRLLKENTKFFYLQVAIQ